MRVMAIDFGTKRIGIALTDELRITAQGRPSVIHTDERRDIDAIKKTVESENVGEVVVGLPLNMDGTHSAKTKEAARFADLLAKALTVPVKTWDERLTSKAADRCMLEGDLSRAKRRERSDMLAAQLILQGYLAAERNRATG